MTSYAYLHRIVDEDGKKKHVYDIHWNSCASGLIRDIRTINKWVSRWPNFCKLCGGTGVRCSIGGTRVHYPIHGCTDPCEDCVVPDDIEKMRCPRCGELIYNSIVKSYKVPQEDLWLVAKHGHDGIIESWLERNGDCPMCGWEHGFMARDYVPEGGGCWCWEYMADDVFYKVARSKPPLLQRIAFRLFGNKHQHRWAIRIYDMPKRLYKKEEELR